MLTSASSPLKPPLSDPQIGLDSGGSGPVFSFPEAHALEPAILILATSAEIDEALCRLLTRYPSYSWAVAWASHSFKACDILLRNRRRIKQLIVGTHFYQTHPEFMAHFVDDQHARFVLNPNGVFHPKAYLFEDGSRWECLLGSANFTQGGLAKNDEMAVVLSSSDAGAEEALRAVKAAIASYWQKGKLLTRPALDGYREMWRAQAPLRAKLAGTFGPSSEAGQPSTDGGRTPLEVPFLLMPWSRYYKDVRRERGGQALPGRLAVLQFARTKFQEFESFNQMDPETRKKIAGTIYEDVKDPDWLWFGSMKGAGTFKNRVAENDEHLSLALDEVPRMGTVDEGHFRAFVSKFEMAFKGLPRGGGGIATATRLLAMKRPDYFVCLDSKNRSNLCAAFDISSSIGFDDYWGSLVERILSAAWWGAPEPDAPQEREVWSGRAAFLDSLFYEGK